MSTIILQSDGPITHVRLNRPEVRNAFNDVLIKELSEAFVVIAKDPSCRVVILSGAGEFFCAGGDLKWMKSFANATPKENKDDAGQIATLLDCLNRFPKPIIGQVHGGAMGGGVGLVSVCDIVVAAEQTIFALPEVKIGLIPAVISLYVIGKIGASAARRYFLTGERFPATEALRLGLIHEVVSADRLSARVEELARELLSSGPAAVAACKEFIWKVGEEFPSPALQKAAAEVIAKLRASPEGQEGMKAFLEKRKPNWC